MKQNIAQFFFHYNCVKCHKGELIWCNKGIEPGLGLVGAKNMFPEISPERFTRLRLMETEDKNISGRKTSRYVSVEHEVIKYLTCTRD